MWANTTLHSTHALVLLKGELEKAHVRVIGQNPLNWERYEDKAWVNEWLAGHERLKGVFPQAVLYKRSDGELQSRIKEAGIDLPCVIKPVRGRGSYGVSRVENGEQLEKGVANLLSEGDAVLIEVSCSVCPRCLRFAESARSTAPGKK